MHLSQTEENYLKAIYGLTAENNQPEAGTNELAATLALKPATIHDMLKKLREKELVQYEKYGKIRLTSNGQKLAVQVIRKHRLWETFLHTTLGFSWNEIHPVAEQLEHIQSELLTERLDAFLGKPRFDPHGDPIPTAEGFFTHRYSRTLQDIPIGEKCRLVAVKDHSPAFLSYLEAQQLQLQQVVAVTDRNTYDQSVVIDAGNRLLQLSDKAGSNLLVTCERCSTQPVLNCCITNS